VVKIQENIFKIDSHLNPLSLNPAPFKPPFFKPHPFKPYFLEIPHIPFIIDDKIFNNDDKVDKVSFEILSLRGDKLLLSGLCPKKKDGLSTIKTLNTQTKIYFTKYITENNTPCFYFVDDKVSNETPLLKSSDFLFAGLYRISPIESDQFFETNKKNKIISPIESDQSTKNDQVSPIESDQPKYTNMYIPNSDLIGFIHGLRDNPVSVRTGRRTNEKCLTVLFKKKFYKKQSHNFITYSL
jgi:hypothetical protein